MEHRSVSPWGHINVFTIETTKPQLHLQMTFCDVMRVLVTLVYPLLQCLVW